MAGMLRIGSVRNSTWAFSNCIVIVIIKFGCFVLGHMTEDGGAIHTMIGVLNIISSYGTEQGGRAGQNGWRNESG